MRVTNKTLPFTHSLRMLLTLHPCQLTQQWWGVIPTATCLQTPTPGTGKQQGNRGYNFQRPNRKLLPRRISTYRTGKKILTAGIKQKTPSHGAPGEPYLIAQACRPLQQRLPRILVDDQAPRLGRHGPAWGALRGGAGQGQLRGLRHREQRGRLRQPLVRLLLVRLGRRGVAV